jgi:Na+/H+-dicarboxylate symporter
MDRDEPIKEIIETPSPTPPILPSSSRLSSGLRGFAALHRAPLYQQIIVAAILGALTGSLAGRWSALLALPAQLILRVLGALATPLILLAVLQSIMQAQLGRRDAARVAKLLILNTLVAIGIGLLVANTLQPGRRAHIVLPNAAETTQPSEEHPNLIEQFFDAVPDSVVRPLVDNNVIGVILLGVAFGLALRSEANKPVHTVQEWVDLAFRAVVRILHVVIAFVPLGVFGIVAGVIGQNGFKPFVALGAFIFAVLCGLILQGIWYLMRIRLKSWVRPIDVLRGTRDATLMAFSTDSSTATMPVTYACLVEKVGLREESARLGALVGTNFNNDGTALYEAMSALFIGQLLGYSLSLPQQAMVVLTSILASVGAAGIPEAGLVTMTLVFNAVGLPLEYIPLLITVDWFLDRCRTVINVMGDVNVSCLLDGKESRKNPNDETRIPESNPNDE